MKLGGKQKNKWQKRHFKLFGNAVAWNKDEASEIDWREAGCSLATIKSVAEIATYKKQENCFEIVGMEKTWQIGASTGSQSRTAEPSLRPSAPRAQGSAAHAARRRVCAHQ